MSLLLLLNPKCFGETTTTDFGPEIWLRVLGDWHKKKKQVEEERERKDREQVVKYVRTRVEIAKDDPRTAELQAQLVEFQALSNSLSKNALLLNELLSASKLEHVLRAEHEARIAKEFQEWQENARRQLIIARQILEMQEEEELLMYLMLQESS